MAAREYQIHIKLEPWQYERLQELPAGERSQKIRRFITEGFAREDQRKETEMRKPGRRNPGA